MQKIPFDGILWVGEKVKVHSVILPTFWLVNPSNDAVADPGVNE